MSESKDLNQSSTETQASAKRPYEKPEFRFESVFETRALSCGKISATNGTCQFNKKSS